MKLFLILLLVFAFPAFAEEKPYWVKTREPMQVVDWIKRPQWVIDNVCGKSENPDEKVLACVVRPGDAGKQQYSRPDGAVIYSLLSKSEAEIKKTCDGTTFARHEFRHVEKGEDHIGKCPSL